MTPLSLVRSIYCGILSVCFLLLALQYVSPLSSIELFALCAYNREKMGVTLPPLVASTNQQIFPGDHQPDEDQHHGSSQSSAEAVSKPAIDSATEDVPPDGGYGWVCTACNFFINGHTWGLNSVSLSWFLFFFGLLRGFANESGSHTVSFSPITLLMIHFRIRLHLHTPLLVGCPFHKLS